VVGALRERRYPPHVRYLAICSTARSGSSLLCHLLRKTNKLGRPEEFFGDFKFRQMSERYGGDDLAGLIEELKRQRRTRNGVFAFKVHRHQFEWLEQRIDIEQTFPEMRWVYIDRSDLLGQAISWAKAKSTGQYSSLHEQRREVVYKYEAVLQAMKALAREKVAWEVHFAAFGIEPLRVTYEQLEEDPAPPVHQIAELMGVDSVVDVQLGDVALEKQRDETNEQWREAFRRDYRQRHAALSKTPPVADRPSTVTP
jgi:LPS sulfotransferase NodH